MDPDLSDQQLALLRESLMQDIDLIIRCGPWILIVLVVFLLITLIVRKYETTHRTDHIQE
jgi:hypothetical protein